jgi:CheY-like chemotaxis protein
LANDRIVGQLDPENLTVCREDKQVTGQADPLRIVIVEDNVDSAYLLRLLLVKWGHTAEMAHTGAAGLQLIAELKPDVAIVDIGLPEIDGYSLARKVRELGGGEQIRLVALSGYGSELDRQRASEAGFDEHLTKPVAAEDLQAVLERK